MRSWIGVWLCAALAWMPADASAGRPGFALIQTGEEIFEVGALPEVVSSPETEGWRAGYKCSVFGLFWAYVHRWDCMPVAFRGDEYSEEPTIVAAIDDQYTMADVQLSPWGRYGRYVLGIGLVAVVLAQLRRG
ncbi:MAG: hypothetical protein KTR31_02945 [Myxococcales bacterium]|nr:hypothetical protein [Myxococcales bacterium]